MGYQHFNLHSRNELSVLLNKGYSLRDITKVLGKSPSSISREVNNNKVNGVYVPDKAEYKAYFRRYRAKSQCMKINVNLWLENYIEEKLTLRWTPEQIAGRLKLENEDTAVISPKSIYNWLGTARGSGFVKYLPYKKPYRKKKKSKGKKEIIKNRVFIEDRPAFINNRSRLKDFEADVLGTTKQEATRLAGIADRQARYLAIKKAPRLKEAMTAYDAMLKSLDGLSATLDNGPENAHHEQLDIPVFFCHPYSSWEKGTIENSFQRLRRFIPKKSKLSNYTDEQLSAIVNLMNNTPRKCLGYKTPQEVFFNEPIQFTIPKIQSVGCCASG